MAVEIIRFVARHAAAFDRLNRAWLTEFELLEDVDLPYLEHPDEMIRKPGGEIFFAVLGDEVLATCAMLRTAPTIFELVKLAVSPTAQRQGLGARISQHAIEWARQQGATRIELVSATRLTAALVLYERLGFQHRPPPDNPQYTTADVYMELEL